MKHTMAFLAFLIQWRDRLKLVDLVEASRELYDVGVKARQASRQELTSQVADPLLLPLVERSWENAKLLCQKQSTAEIGWGDVWPLSESIQAAIDLLPPLTEAPPGKADDKVPPAYRAGGNPEGAPLTAAKCAEILGVAESTVSRTVATDRIDNPEGRGYLIAWQAVVRYAKSKDIDIAKWQS